MDWNFLTRVLEPAALVLDQDSWTRTPGSALQYHFEFCLALADSYSLINSITLLIQQLTQLDRRLNRREIDNRIIFVYLRNFSVKIEIFIEELYQFCSTEKPFFQTEIT